jgi:uncharacterized membrane protein
MDYELNILLCVLQPNMYYDSQNYQNGQQQQQQQAISASPAYHKYLAGGGDVSVGMPCTSPLGYKEVPRWSWSSTVCSVLSLLVCCTHVFGFLGLLCSVFSYVDHKAGDYEHSRYKRRCSWACTVLGIVFALLGALAVILVFVVFPNQLRQTLRLVNYDADPLRDWQHN